VSIFYQAHPPIAPRLAAFLYLYQVALVPMLYETMSVPFSSSTADPLFFPNFPGSRGISFDLKDKKILRFILFEVVFAEC